MAAGREAEFPLDATDVASLLGSLDVTVPSLDRATYELDALIERVIDPHDELLAVPVSKHRVHYVLDGCMAELTDVRSGSRTTRTIAVENEDPAVVRSTVEALGLWSRPNVSFPRGLALLVGARRRAVIDVGTNSVKFVVGERSADGSWTDLVDRSEVTRLGQGLAASDRLDPEAIQRTTGNRGDGRRGRSHEVEEVVAAGTAWMRAAHNADELVAAVHGRSSVGSR